MKSSKKIAVFYTVILVIAAIMQSVFGYKPWLSWTPWSYIWGVIILSTIISCAVVAFKNDARTKVRAK